ncbi:DUF1302 domain-containing protein [Pseudomarimonas arenosa]|uniref:DUF1302 domain-containing protein n=1 Tax=Pseudomarimonas arenosa TaxID=2774145 RepID=A0AAW3ZLD2_9GAMM|nr:DUF1302 domain-containing protein [Pseudomarimonas arenosa]MBD8526953.1 DUF1302 domain-containing protein [Pseudomarimonas arenosa]
MLQRPRLAPIHQLAAGVLIALGSVWTQSANAIELDWGAVQGSLDTTLSIGASWRVADRDDDLLGKAHFNPALVAQVAALQAQGRFLEAQALQVAARGRFSVNRDDGNLKYNQGDLISNAVKLTSELALNWDNGGAFARASYFYDVENARRDDLTRSAKNLIGERFRLLDAFVYHNFEYGDSGSGTLRVGRQVISWGESTFIRNGINVINAVDPSALRVAGAEVKEAFLPLDAVWTSLSLSSALSLELAYLLEFEEIEVDAAGTYFSANDFASPGSTYVMLGFGSVPQPVNDPGRYFATCFTGANGLVQSDRFAELSDRFGPQTAATLIGAGCAASFPRAASRAAPDDGQYGLALRYYAEDFFDTEFGFYYLRHHSRFPLLSGLAVTSAAANSGRFFMEYPEDLDLFGLSWNTSLPGGWAWQGEISHRPDMPLQVDDVELLFAGLSPANLAPHIPELSFNSQLGQFLPGQYIRGWRQHEVSQLQWTLSRAFGPGNWLGADQLALVVEFGGTKVWDLPSQSELRYEGEGTDTGGGPDISDGVYRNPLTQRIGFPTAFSWGYRGLLRASYNNVFGSAFNLNPRFAFNHDVNGITPGPGGNFLQGRKSYTLGAEAIYLDRWSVDLSYTVFSGAGGLNQISDRDFASLAIKYAF